MVSEFVKVPSDPSLSPGVAFNVVTRPGLESQAKYTTSKQFEPLLMT